MKKDKIAPRRMIFNISEELYNAIKERADYQYLTLRGWLLQAITEKIERENYYINSCYKAHKEGIDNSFVMKKKELSHTIK